MEQFNSKEILTALVTGISDDEEMKKGVRAGRYDVVFSHLNS